MLKQIIFVLGSDELPYMQTIIADIAYLGEVLAENVVGVSCVIYRHKSQSDEDVLLPSPDAAITDTLYVTDDAEVLDELLAKSYYAIALQHDFVDRADLQKALYVISELRDLDFDCFLKAYERLAGLPWHILDTARLTIRETTIADVDEFYRIYSDPLITRHIDPLFLDINEEKEYAAEYIRTIYGIYGYGIWTVVLKESGEVIGRAGLSMREGYSYPELGFVIAHAHQRRGYAEEALRSILVLAKTELAFDIIQTLIQPENSASLSLCRKLGFIEKDTVYLNERPHLLLILEL